METRYEPKAVEQRWYDAWEQRGYFKPRESLTGKTFTISMPPPNITGDLHMGHAMYTLEDVLIRWHRMLGPGRTTPRSPPRMSSRSSWPRKARRKKRSAGTPGIDW